MSVNKYKPHVYVIPEDDAERQVADGFTLHSSVDIRQIDVVRPPGGWSKVLDTFHEQYVSILRGHQYAHVVLLIDFDNSVESRREFIARQIPSDVADRVFVIGPQDEAETLKREFENGGLESIGTALANDCDRQELTNWCRSQLAHNEAERARLAAIVRPFLFGNG